jgi:alkylated DNA repair dioxygenase AlkB
MRSDEIGASYTPRPAAREGGQRVGGSCHVAFAIAPGVEYFPGFLDHAGQEELREEVQAILVEAPLFRLSMPRTCRPFSVRMSNFDPLG